MKASLLAVFSLLCIVAYSQQAAPGIKWQKSLGGTLADQANAVAATADGGCVIAGFTNSNDSDITGNHGQADYLIIKLNSSGTPQWKKGYGGTSNDYATAVQQTADGGYIVAGYTGSSDGNVTGHHYNSSKPNNYDYWILKLDVAGNIVWKKCYGGSQDDYARRVQQTADGGYIVAGRSNSSSGDITSRHGAYDVWLIKLDTAGTLQWQKTYGSSKSEDAYDIKQTPDGGYIVAGETDGIDGDVSGLHTTATTALIDFWIFKINATGTLQWQKCYGGTQTDGAKSIALTADGGYIAAGNAWSYNGDLPSRVPSYFNYWVIKLNATGSLQWQQVLGGNDNDYATSVLQTSEGDYVIAGYTGSKDGNATGNHGFYDILLVKLNNGGDLKWQKTFGGTGYEYAYGVAPTSDKGYFFTGSSGAVSGDVTRHLGAAASPDMWVVRLKPDTTKTVQTISFPYIYDKYYGDADFALNATASSGLPVTYTSSDTNVITIVGGNKGHIKKAGYITITATQAGNSVYAPASMVRGVYVNRASQSITFPTPGSTHNVLEGFIKLKGTATSGLPITYTSSDTSILTISHDTAFLKKDGYVTIKAVQDGNVNYSYSATISNNIYINGVSVTAPYTFICPNTSLTFTATAYFAPAGTSYQWKKNRVNVGNNSANYTDSTLVNNDSILVVASYNGKVYASKPVRMAVQAPVVNISSTSIQVCQGSNYAITAYASGPGTIPSVTWKKNNITVSGYYGYTYNDATLHNGDSIWCIIHPTAACNAASPGLVSNKIKPKVLPTGPVVATINYQPSNYKLCVPGDTTTITFHVVGTNGGTNPSFQWLVNNVNIPNSDTSFYTLHGLKSGDKINCIYTSNQTCTTNGIKGVLSNTVTLATTPPLAPVVTIAQSPDTTMCYGTKIRFKTSSIYGSGSNPIYQWMRNGQPVGTNSDVYYDSTLINGDSVWCVMTTDYPCAISPAVSSNKLRPRIDYGLPPAPPTITGPATVTAGKQHVGYVVPLYGAVTYLWSVPAGASIYTGQHTYQILVNWGNTGGTLIAQTRNSCGYSDKTRLVVTVTPAMQGADGFEEQSTISGIASSKAQIYPNPATTNTTVSFTAVEAGKYMAQVVDAQGRILQVRETNAAKGRNTININVSGYAKGSYFVRLSNKNGKQQATFTLVVGK